MKRNLYVGATFVARWSALGVGSTVLDKRATVEAAGAQAPGSKWTRCGRSRCRTTGSWAT